MTPDSPTPGVPEDAPTSPKKPAAWTERLTAAALVLVGLLGAAALGSTLRGWLLGESLSGEDVPGTIVLVLVALPAWYLAAAVLRRRTRQPRLAAALLATTAAATLVSGAFLAVELSDSAQWGSAGERVLAAALAVFGLVFGLALAVQARRALKWRGDGPGARPALLQLPVTALIVAGFALSVPVLDPLPAERLEAQTDLFDAAQAHLDTGEHRVRAVTFKEEGGEETEYEIAEGSFDADERSAEYTHTYKVSNSDGEEVSIQDIDVPAGEAGALVSLGTSPLSLDRAGEEAAGIVREWDKVGTVEEDGRTLTQYQGVVDQKLEAHLSYLRYTDLDGSYREKQLSWGGGVMHEVEHHRPVVLEAWLDEAGHLRRIEYSFERYDGKKTSRLVYRAVYED